MYKTLGYPELGLKFGNFLFEVDWTSISACFNML